MKQSFRYLRIRWIRWEITKSMMKYLSYGTCFHAGFLLNLFFDPEDGGYMFLRNVGWHSADYMALYPRRLYSSQPPLWKPQILRKVGCLMTLSVAVLYSAFAWRDCGKLRKSSVGIAGVSAKIRTEHLPNMSLERYSHRSLLSKSICSTCWPTSI
jgi:hypothetical protein